MRFTREELGQELLQSKRHWAEVGVRKPANTPTSTEVLLGLRHRLQNQKNGFSGLFSGLGTFVVRAQPVPSARPTSNATRAVQQQPLTQTPPGISLPMGASLPNPTTPAPTSLPNYGNQTLNSNLGVATAVPVVPSGPWSFTRQAYKGTSNPATGVDVNTIPISAGVSVASAGSQQPQLSQQQWATGSVAGTSGVLPQGQACPVQAVGGHTLQPQVPLTTSTPEEPISRNKSSLPKLQVKGGDATTITRTINEWVQKTAIALNTWSLQASTFWHQAVTAARAQHNWWLSLQPSDRASFIGLPTTNQTLPTQTPVVEATVRAELLNSVLPDKVTSMAMQKGALTVLDLLFLTFQTFLPSEPSARVDGLNAVETPLRAAKNFNEALTTLRTWRQQILTVVTDLQGNPEPLKLFNSLKVLISNLVSSDNSFATEVSQMYRNTGIKNSCTDQALLQLMGLLEIEMSARAMEDDEERRRKGQANAAAAATSSTQATAAAVGKGKKKGGGKSKDSKGKGKKTQTTVCQDYMTDRGCPRGDQCTFAHPRKPGKCLRCGGINHDLSTCRRPPRDPKLNAPNSNAKPKGSGGKGNPPPVPKKGKGKGAAKAKAKSKAQPKNTSKGGANAVWACEEIVEDATASGGASLSMAILNPTDDSPGPANINATACTFYTTFLPTFHSAANSDEPMEEHPENQPILDTGATHCLMPLSWLSEAECEAAKRIHLKVATGSTVRALLYNNVIYAKSVNRPLVSVGQLKGMIDLRFIWDDASPLLVTCHAGKKYVVLKANIVHHLPLISRSSLQTLLNAIHDFTTKGEIWDLKKWSSELNHDLDEFHWSNPSSTPAGYHINAETEPQTMYSAIDFMQEGAINSTDLVEEKFSTRYAEPTAEVAEKDPQMTAVAENGLNPIASATTGALEEQLLPKSAPKKFLGHLTCAKNGPSDDRTLTATATAVRGLNSHHSTTEIHDLEECDAMTEDATVDDINALELQDAMAIVQCHSLPKARSRTNIATDAYTPQGRLFGAFTTRGEGITQATYRYPKVVNAIHRIALERGKEAETEGYLSAQLNRASALPVHKDKNNHGLSWLIALGDFDGGRLWIEDPLGSQPPPKCTHAWEKNLRGSYHDVKNKWFQFNPSRYHAVEGVTRGVRTSIALFSPRSWTRIPPHSLSELADVGFFPPRSAMSTQLLDQIDTSDFNAMPAEDGDGTAVPDPDNIVQLTTPTQEEEKEIQEWCVSEHVALPFNPLETSDGTVKPLTEKEEKELRDHVNAGHLTKCHLCKGCLLSEGPRRVHRRVRDVDRATHVLHIDIAGPFNASYEGFHYFLVGALRLPDLPLLIDVRLLRTRTSVEVCAALEKMTAYFESLSFEGFEIKDSTRIKRLHSDRAGEFTAPFFEKFLSNHRSIYHTLTSGYDPQANGTAERSVGLIKTLASRCLNASGLPEEFWTYSVRYAARKVSSERSGKSLRTTWKTTDPVFLAPGINFSFLGICVDAGAHPFGTTVAPEDLHRSAVE